MFCKVWTGLCHLFSTYYFVQMEVVYWSVVPQKGKHSTGFLYYQNFQSLQTLLKYTIMQQYQFTNTNQKYLYKTGSINMNTMTPLTPLGNKPFENTVFSTSLNNFLLFSSNVKLSAKCFNLEESKIYSLVMG